MKFFLIVGVLSFLVFCGNKNDIQDTKVTRIRVINATNKSFSNVVLFSIKFEDLKPNDTTAYKNLDFDPLLDDSLIYCSIGDTNFARYLDIPEENDKTFSYVIDSIQDGIMYVSSVREN